MRESVAKVLTEMFSVFPAELTPALLSLVVDDEESVRLIVLKRLADVCGSVDKDELESTVLPAGLSLMSNPEWRVRSGVLEQLPSIAKIIGIDGFVSSVQESYFNAFTDDAASVRRAACESIVPLVEALGDEEWGACYSISDGCCIAVCA